MEYNKKLILTGKDQNKKDDVILHLIGKYQNPVIIPGSVIKNRRINIYWLKTVCPEISPETDCIIIENVNEKYVDQLVHYFFNEDIIIKKNLHDWHGFLINPKVVITTPSSLIKISEDDSTQRRVEIINTDVLHAQMFR